MPNFFKSIGQHLEHTLWTQPKHIVTDVAHGDFKGAFKDWKGTFGQNERDLSKVFASVGIRGWVGKHPQESIGAAVATVFGGWAAWGAYGAGAAGGAAGAAGGGIGSGGIAAGTAIGQTVPATPAMIGAAAQGGTVASTGATIGMGGSAAANAAAMTSTPSMVIASGTSSTGVSLASGGAPASHLTGQVADVGSASGTNGGGSSWLDWANKANQGRNMLQNSNSQQQGSQQQQQLPMPRADHDLLHALMHSSLNNPTTANSGQMQPQTTTDIISGNQLTQGADFKNQF